MLISNPEPIKIGIARIIDFGFTGTKQTQLGAYPPARHCVKRAADIGKSSTIGTVTELTFCSFIHRYPEIKGAVSGRFYFLYLFGFTLIGLYTSSVRKMQSIVHFL
jgi:hypothetical protein